MALVDEVLGPVFRATGMDLEAHLPRIASFSEVTLLGSGSYVGRPMQLRRHLAAVAGLGAAHFEGWLVLWQRTLASLFQGPTGSRAGTDAHRMSLGMLRDLDDHQPREQRAGTKAIHHIRENRLSPP